MGWFDKKSWQMRRKLKDLQAELATAEKSARFINEQGVYFADIKEMGDATMMVVGTVDTLAAQEEKVIHTFFERNGFSVQSIKFDRGYTGLTDIEILAPEELTRHVARLMKAEGFRMVDDSDRERLPDMSAKVFPLSALLRSIVIHFSEKIKLIILSSEVHHTMEGNRLLHWIPKITETLERKVPAVAVEATLASFNDAFCKFYGSIDGSRKDLSTDEKVRKLGLAEAPEPAKAAPIAPAGAINLNERIPVSPSAGKPSPTNRALQSNDMQELARSRSVLLFQNRMLKGMLRSPGASTEVRSANTLTLVNEYFDASSACLLIRIPRGDGYKIFANAGNALQWGEGAQEGYPVSSSVLMQCVQSKKVVSTSQAGTADPSASMIALSIESAAAAPVLIDDEIAGILYVDRRANLTPMSQAECASLEEFASFFAELSEKLMGLTKD